MEFWLRLLVQLVITVVVTAAVTFAWAFAAARFRHLNKPLEWDATSGIIRPWPPLWWIMSAAFGVITLACAAVAVVGAITAYNLSAIIAVMYVAMTAFFGFATWCSALALLPSAQVTWNSSGVTGPRSQVRPGHREIQWSEIAHVGRTWLSYYFIENGRGDRVFWSYTYVGSGFFWNVLVSKRSDLLDQAKIAVTSHG